MGGFRMDRINSQLMREISRILMGEVKDDKACLAIVTSVECSRDLKYAKVYFTTLDAGRRGSIGQALEKTAGFIRKRLGSMLHYRTVPQLTFVYDETEDRAREMDQLLDHVVSELPPDGPEETSLLPDEADDGVQEP